MMGMAAEGDHNRVSQKKKPIDIMVRSDGYHKETTIKYNDKTVERTAETIEHMKMASKGDPVTYKLESSFESRQQQQSSSSPETSKDRIKQREQK